MASRSLSDLSLWLEAEDSRILELLARPGLVLDAPTASALRDRSAASVMSDPSFSFQVSTLLMALLRRMGPAADELTRAHAWRCRAEACLFTGRLRQARKAYEKASNAAAKSRKGDLLGQILVGRIHLLSLLGEASPAEALARQAENLLRRSGNRPYLAKLHMNRGNAFYQQERYEQARAAYQRAAELFEAMGQRDATWTSLLMNQAIALTQLSRIREARELFLKTEKQCRGLDQDALLAHCQFNRSYLEALSGNFREALRLLEESEKTFLALGIADMMASARRSRAEIYLDLGLAEESFELAEEAARSFQAEDMQVDAALALQDAARALLEKEDHVGAARRLETLSREFSKLRLPRRMAQARLLLAACRLGQERPEEAGRLARSALRIFKSRGMIGQEAAARRVLAESLLMRRQGRRAETALEPALHASARLPLDARAGCWELAGRIADFLGRRREAGRRWRRARDLVEARRALIPGAEFRTRSFQRQKRVYEELVNWTLESPSPRFDALYSLVESARGRGFRERMGRRAPSPRGLERTAEDRSRLGSLTRRIESGELEGLDGAKLARLRGEARELERRILDRLRRAEGLEAGGGTWSPSLAPEKLAKLLGADECLVEFFLVGDHVLALFMDRRTRHFRLLPRSAAEIRKSLRRLTFHFDLAALSGGSSPRLESSRRSTEKILGELYRALLGPLEDLLPERGKLVLVAESFLHAAPFECLYDGARYMDERFRILRSPRGDFLRRRKSPAPGRGEIVLAGLREGGPAQVEAELEAVAACFSERKRSHRLLLDPQSGELLKVLPRCRLLHLSSHGRFRDDNPLFSRLSTRKGALFLADIQALELRSELIVLSACEGGKVLAGGGDDLAGVAHGFLGSGARALLASRWRVHDEATRDLMASFYCHWLSGRSRDTARALAEAMRETREKWPHPFFWGGFSLFGA